MKPGSVVQIRPSVGRMLYRDFLEEGRPIFPLLRFKRGKCECGNADCEAVGKHPRASNWQHSPLWDDEQMENMEEAGFFDTGYGVLCRGMLIVDVDARNGGIASYTKLIEEVPDILGAGLVVNTGSGGGSQHLYFTAPADVSFVSHLKEYPGIDFKSSGYVVGPGSAHVSGGVYTCDGSPSDITDAPQGLIDLLRMPERHRSEYNGHAVDLSQGDIAGMVACIRNGDLDYDTWISVGMAIHHATQGTGYALWAEWSATSAKHDDSNMDKKWHSFGRCSNPVTLGTLIHYAEQGGWKMPVAFVPDQKFHEDSPTASADGLPFDISGVDLTAPPGLVGDVARWIESQSMRPRRHLAVAAALTAIGNIAGLRYVDDLTSVTTNLFTFCVAGARTGKEAIQQAVISLHKAAGIAPATHGAMKSEQEVSRNLIRHQAAFYVVDEFGIFLTKVKNAQKRGGATHLEGLIGILMNAYSKANSWMLLTGDGKEEVRAQLLKELSQLMARQEERPEDKVIERRIAAVERALANLDNGLEKPFLSLMGCTTPSTFQSLVDHDMATSGFVGRALIFDEKETVPAIKRPWNPQPMPETMANYMAALYQGGEYDLQGAIRVENYEDRFVVPTDPAAVAMLDAVSQWMETQAQEHKETGLESLYMGAYELVSKVSLILAIPDRLRSEEHVRWAFALIRRDIREKIRLVQGNDTDKSFRNEALRARILNLIAGEEGEKEGVIVNRVTRAGFVKADIMAELDLMAKGGAAEILEKKHPGNGSVSKRYREVR